MLVVRQANSSSAGSLPLEVIVPLFGKIQQVLN
jgi:hypothetical protein